MENIWKGCSGILQSGVGKSEQGAHDNEKYGRCQGKQQGKLVQKPKS